MSSKITPLVGIVSCRRNQDGHYFHMVGEKYIKAINDYTDCAGVLIPAVKDELLNESILDKLDGFLLTGSLSNVHPDRYNVELIDDKLIVDESRDSFVFSMIDAILEREIPLFAICRGFQEMNVAFGGTLYQDLDRDSTYKDHDFKRDDPQEIQYGVSHKVSFINNGLLHQITGVESAEVNSLHAQGVQELGDGLNDWMLLVMTVWLRPLPLMERKGLIYLCSGTLSGNLEPALHQPLCLTILVMPVKFLQKNHEASRYFRVV